MQLLSFTLHPLAFQPDNELYTKDLNFQLFQASFFQPDWESLRSDNN